jgi:hypothetical protein
MVTSISSAVTLYLRHRAPGFVSPFATMIGQAPFTASARDPFTFIAVIMLVMVVSMIAALVPSQPRTAT